MVAKILGAQRDFSFGEVDATLKRNDDHPARKSGLRQMANARILNSGSVQDRPGRRAIYPVTNNGKRTERFSISAGHVYDIQFAAGTLKMIDSTGLTVATFTVQGNGAPLPWVSQTDIAQIRYAVMNLNVTITFGHAMRPQVLTFDGVSAWTIADFTEAVTVGGQKRTPFYRISPQNVILTPSANRGAITILFSSPIAVAAMAGSRIRWAGRQILLGSLISSLSMNATVIEPLPPSQTLTLSGSVGNFNVGDEVEGNSSGAKGIVVSNNNVQTLQISLLPGPAPGVGQTITGLTSGATGVVTGYSGLGVTVSLTTGTAFTSGENANTSGGASITIISVSSTGLVVQLIQTTPGSASTFLATEVVGGPSGTATTSAVSTGAPAGIAVWDDEVMNDFRGYPASVFTDQFRLGFCDFPSVPGGIEWSAINSPTDLFTDGNPAGAMFEIAPAKVRVYDVVPGPESSEFVFTDRRVYYIPISPTNPLKPGSVQFAILSGDGAAQVQPRIAQEAILYVNAGQNSVMAIIATGAYLRPFNTKNLCEFHSHLFNNIQCLAFPTADGSFNERYAYVLSGDGSIAVGKYDADTLASANVPTIGWGPWSGAGIVSWISAFAANVIFTTSYFGTTICEVLDDSQYLDCAILVNAPPGPFAPPAGKGPLWFIPGQSVTLIDQVTRVMGTYQIDANGFIIPQGNGGENLLAGSLVAGQPWTMTIEPFCPDASPGQAVGQRMFKRRVSRFAVSAIHSTGFVMARLFSGSLTPTSPALGTIMNFTRFPPWNVGDDATKPPPQREIVERTRPIGRSYDPRVAVVKDVPGPLQILELGIECTV